MTDYGTFVAPDTIRFERLLPGPVERVWMYLTDPDKRARWLAGGPMRLVQGGEVALRFRNAELSPEPSSPPAKYVDCAGEVASHGHVLRSEPPRLLSYSWGEGKGDHSEVTFELSEQGVMVRLVLTHRRLKDRGTRLSVAGGWHTHLDILADVLAGRTPAAFWPRLERVEAEYERRIAG
jgi:uncharacterized protein YndB with AHSA1/START domain